jgi:GT2 family glycosyltransferase
MRVSDFKKVNGFDEKIFLYVEDVDLTRRLHKITKTVYYPEIEVEHGLARGSYKFSKLVVYHINSAIYYFNKWGWFFDKSREHINAIAADPFSYVHVHKTIKMPVLYNEDANTEQLQAKA